jgi:hypothetical protein
MHLHLTPNSTFRRFAAITQPGRWRNNARRTALVLLAAAAAVSGLGGTGEARGDVRPIELRADMLAAHNAARRNVGLGPMVWSAELAGDARKHASQMSRSRHFAHSNQLSGARPQGENLWMGTHNAYSFAEMAGSWVDEREQYAGGSISDAISDGTFGVIGHYTQVIWRETTKVGCAVVSNADDDYLVCRYFPAGNVMGEGPLD